MQGDAVVRPDGVDLEPERLAQPGGERERPRRVHAAAERREDAEPPVADLVAEPLHHDRPVGREDTGRLLLLAQVGEQVAGGPLVEPMPARQSGEGLVVGQRDQLARRAADRLAELVRTPRPLALPERDRARDAGRR